LAAGCEVEYWRDRADQAGLLEKLEDEWLKELVSDDELTVAVAIAGLGGIGTLRLVEQLVPMLEADFAEGVGRDVLHLTTLCQRRAVAALSKMPCPEASAALDRWTPQGMVLIPADPFIMGSTESDDEGPVHQVWLDAFWIARYPVTNAEYTEFIEDGGYERQEYWTEAGWDWKEEERRTQPPKEWDRLKGKGDYPVRYIAWFEAVAYARWRGAMLPSEAQWEKTARGGARIPNLKSQISLVDNPNPERRFPWGNEFDKNKCNTSESGIRDTMPVGKYSPAGDSPYGVAGMSGNVWEWTSSLYRPYPYSVEDGREDPEASGPRVLRGGSWYRDWRLARCAYRNWLDPGYRGSDVGFRVGWDAALALPSVPGF
jgi:formylglycine-generating enzyme required for sulfatase activity